MLVICTTSEAIALCTTSLVEQGGVQDQQRFLKALMFGLKTKLFSKHMMQCIHSGLLDWSESEIHIVIVEDPCMPKTAA